MINAQTPSSRTWLGIHWTRWDRNAAPALMITSFCVASLLAGIVLIVFGLGDRGTVLALRVTSRWSFALFWMAYTGAAVAKLVGPRLEWLGRSGRELGLAFASAQLVHLALVLWLYRIATGPVGAMIFFWIGIGCVYGLALFSLPRFRNALAPHIWRISRTIAIEYIALVFAYDFILGPLHAGIGQYPSSYVPFALMLVGGACLRAFVFAGSLWSRHLSAP